MPSAPEPNLRRFFYGRRKGHALTRRQQDLLTDRLLLLEIDLTPGEENLDPAALFDTPPSECWLEIGFGKGEHLAWQAERHETIGFLGCEPFINGVAGLLARVEEQALSNVRIYPDEAGPLLEALAPDCLSRIFLLHPDPWPKHRHRSRRFISADNLDRLARVMAPGAQLRIGTDAVDYVDWTKEHMAGRDDFALEAEMEASDKGSGLTDDWPETRYQAKAKRQGRGAIRLIYVRL